MVEQIATVRFDKPAGTGTFDITSSSITETFSAAILVYTRESVTNDNVNQSMGVVGVGFIGVNGAQGESSLQCTMSMSLEDGVTANAGAATGRSILTCIRCGDGAGGLDTIAAYDSSIAGGVRLNFTQCDRAFSGTAILFAGFSKAATGGCTHTEAGSHEEVGAAADQFQPDLVIFLPSDNSLAADTINATLALGFALNSAGIPQICSYLNWDNNSDPTDADGFYRSDVADCAFIGDRITSQDRFQITSFDSTGWNATAVDTGDSNTPQANYLALKFANPTQWRTAIAHMPIAASTGNQAFNSFGFTPDLVFGMVHFLATSNTVTDGPTAAAGGYFATGRYGSRAQSVSMQEGLDIGVGVPSVARTRQGDHAIICLDHTATLSLQADWVGGSASGGFVLNFTTASQAGMMTAIGLQHVPDTPRRLRPHRKRLATKRNRRPTKRGFVWTGLAPTKALPRFWRAIQRFRKAMALRLLRRPLPLAEEATVTPSAADQEAEGAIFAAGAKRGETTSAGSAAGGIF